MQEERIDYFERYNPFGLKEKIFGRITRLEKSLDGKSLYIDLCLTNEKLIRHNSIFYSNEGFLTSLISYRNSGTAYDYDRLVEYFEADREEIVPFIYSNTQQDYDMFEYPSIALEQIAKNLRPYLFCLEGNVSLTNFEFLEYCYKLQAYFQMELIACEEKYIKDYESRNEDDIIWGAIFFSASPSRQRYAKLKINDKDLKALNVDVDKDGLKLSFDSIINNTNLDCLTDTLTSILPSQINRIDFTCFNVGSGLNTNIDIISKQNEKTSIKFDIGVSMSKDESFQYDYNEFYNTVTSKFLQLPSIIVLSHWDTDHIKGINYCDTIDIFRSIWIAPNINDLSDKDVKDYAKMLCIRICIQEKIDKKRYLYLISNYFNGDTFYENSYIKLCRTKGISSNTGNTRKNNYGNIMEIFNSKRLLLTGDSDYNNLPACVANQEYDVFIMPHHGSKNQNPNFFPSNIFPLSPIGLGCCTCMFGCIHCYDHFNFKNGACEPFYIDINSLKNNRHQVTKEFADLHIADKYSISIIPVGKNTHNHPRIDEIEKIQSLGFITWCTCCNGTFNMKI